MNNILITGGSGFIGSHTCLVFLQNGYNITVLDSHINSSPIAIDKVRKLASTINSSNKGKISLIEGDIRDESLLYSLFKKVSSRNKMFDAVIHLAGLKSVSESISNPIDYWNVNVGGTLTLLKIMNNFDCRTIVFSSSATVYKSNSDELLTETSQIQPSNPYGSTKATVERFLADLTLENNNSWKIASLRYFNPAGCHSSGLIGEDPTSEPNNLFPYISQVAIKKREFLKIFGNDWPTIDGTGVRDYIHVMDLAEAHYAALKMLFIEKPQCINLNIGTNKATSVFELVQTFESVNSVKIPYKIVNRRMGDVAFVIAKNDLAISKLNWSPTRNIDDICRDGYNWQIKNPLGYN